MKEKLNLRTNEFGGLEDAGNQQVNCIGSTLLALIEYFEKRIFVKTSNEFQQKNIL